MTLNYFHHYLCISSALAGILPYLPLLSLFLFLSFVLSFFFFVCPHRRQQVKDQMRKMSKIHELHTFKVKQKKKNMFIYKKNKKTTKTTNKYYIHKQENNTTHAVFVVLQLAATYLIFFFLIDLIDFIVQHVKKPTTCLKMAQLR